MLVRGKCEELSRKRDQPNAFTWTSVVCGHFVDFGLWSGYLKFDLDKHHAQILDGGDVKASMSTLQRVTDALIRILSQPQRTQNKTLFIQSFCTTQLELLASLERGTKVPWSREQVDSKAFLEHQLRHLENGDKKAADEIVYALGLIEGDWTLRADFANCQLGLEDENIDDVVAMVLSEHDQYKSY
ncbi:hypothetical protein O9K51_10055 [Purpureocillium lavendulum]|uniref:Uncharacterized protein n=1 Tax=Purpureocillium lavendulum TaxID=1247861 RepID=A0AB34FEM4_9HYPO|nr:hypothetical protein O9K51_10055 [Purpureocillium lavendulum]